MIRSLLTQTIRSCTTFKVTPVLVIGFATVLATIPTSSVSAEVKLYCGFMSKNQVSPENFIETASGNKQKDLIPIVMEIDSVKAGTARYLYRKHRKEIPLKVEVANSTKTVLTNSTGSETFTLKEVIKEREFEGMTGTWTAGGQTLNVLMDGFSADFAGALSAPATKPALTNLGTRVEFVADVIGHRRLYPKVVSIEGSGTTTGPIGKFEQWRSEHGLAPSNDICDDFVYIQDLQAELATPHILSIRNGLSGMARGAAYPLNNAGDQYTFDLKIGREISTKDIFKNDPATREALTKLFFAHAIKEYEELVKFKAKQKAEGGEATDDGECYTDREAIDIPDGFHSVYVRFRKSEIGVARSIWRWNCSDDYKWVPLAKVKPYVKQGTSFYDYVQEMKP